MARTGKLELGEIEMELELKSHDFVVASKIFGELKKFVGQLGARFHDARVLSDPQTQKSRIVVRGLLRSLTVSPVDPPTTGLPQRYFATFFTDVPPSHEVTVEITQAQFKALSDLNEVLDSVSVEWEKESMTVWREGELVAHVENEG